MVVTRPGQAREWLDAGEPRRVAVNVSMRDLFDARFADSVREILADAALPAEQLTLEITESALMADQDRVVDTITRLRALGFAVSIDDYGTGYSSIAYLRRLAADE